MANLQKPSAMLETSCGSPHYASPEIIRGEKYDGPSSDSWSCGVILFALVTGNLPFDDENMRRLLTKVKQGEYSVPDFVSPGPKELIQNLMNVNAKERWSLKQVMNHPWFHSRKPKENLEHLRSPLEDDQFELGFPSDFKFEQDLLDALKLLGWSDQQQLVSRLQEQGKNAEKVYYNLLKKRKWEILEHYNEEGNKYSVDGGPMRRAESFGIDSPEVERGSRRSLSEPFPKSKISLVPSPLSNEKPIAINRKPLPLLKINSSDRIDSPNSPRLQIAQAFQTLGIGTPKFHRNGTPLSPIKDGAGSSPLISRQAKTSWFQAFFNFKPEIFYLISSKSLIDTIAILEPILNVFRLLIRNK
jgi:serine/threonine protein kinase